MMHVMIIHVMIMMHVMISTTITTFTIISIKIFSYTISTINHHHLDYPDSFISISINITPRTIIIP